MSMYDEIEDILDNFDFEKVKKVMDALEWVYHDSPDNTVSIAELRKMARGLLKEVYNSSNSDHRFTACGGFEVERWMYPGETTKYLYLKFVVSEWNNAN